MLFDTHTHYNDPRFDEDRDAVLSSMQENNVGYILNAGCSVKSSGDSIALAEKYDFIYSSAERYTFSKFSSNVPTESNTHFPTNFIILTSLSRITFRK
ncbi:MAG: TatD family hydrolase [Clostridia bacterium]|nr:TatD family hydrolase [Clostridia bacterium]